MEQQAPIQDCSLQRGYPYGSSRNFSESLRDELEVRLLGSLEGDISRILLLKAFSRNRTTGR